MQLSGTNLRGPQPHRQPCVWHRRESSAASSVLWRGPDWVAQDQIPRRMYARNAHQNELLPVSATVNLIAAYAPGASRTLSCTDLHSGTPSTQVACLPFSQLLPMPAWCF